MKTIEITVLNENLEKVDYLKTKYDDENIERVVKPFIKGYKRITHLVNNILHETSFKEGFNTESVIHNDVIIKFKFEDCE